MSNICIILGQAPYTAERPYTAMRFAYTAAINDHKVKIFLFEDAIYVAKKNQNPTNVYNVGEWVEKCLEEDVEIMACGVCTKARGMDPSELIEGIGEGTMETCLNYVLESDKQLFF